MQKRRKLFFEEEKKKNFTQWYFNNEREIFDKCNEYFKICNDIIKLYDFFKKKLLSLIGIVFSYQSDYLELQLDTKKN